MVRVTAMHRLLVIGSLAIATTSARIIPRIPQTASSSPTAASATAASTTPAPSETQPEPLQLLSIANSLISEGYSGQTISNLRTLSFPTTVVIGTHTYTVDPKSTSSASSSHTTSQSSKTHNTIDPTATGEKVSTNSGDQKGDKRLAIILGVVLGCLAFAIMGVILCCLHRRRKDNGSFFLRRTTPSMRSNGSWMPNAQRPDTFGTTTYVSAGQPEMHSYEPKYPEASVIQRGPTPPVMAHPAFLHHESSRSTSDENPFYTPQERSTTHLNPYEIDGQEVQQAELEHEEPNRRSSHSARNSRPPTPFSPLEMMTQMPGPAARPQVHQNPFASPEDDEEAQDLVSPIVPPARNAERRHSPMVHYPSWDEVSAFSFSGDERDSRYEDGGDGWRPNRERRDGRYELA